MRTRLSPGSGRLPPGITRLRLAEGVDLDLRGAVPALKPAVVGGLDAALADLVVGQVAFEPGLLELLGIDLAQVAQDGAARPPSG